MTSDSLQTLIGLPFAACGTLVPTMTTVYPRLAHLVSHSPHRTAAFVLAGALALTGVLLGESALAPWGLAMFLVLPIPQLALVNVSHRLFERLTGREPLDVSYNFAPGLWVDRVYAIAVCVLGVLLVIPIIGPFRPK